MDDIPEKICSKCEGSFPATTEYFNKQLTNRDGLRGWCKGCQAIYAHAHYLAHPDDYKASAKASKEANPERVKAVRADYGIANAEIIKKKDRDRYPARREERQTYLRIYRKSNPEKIITIKRRTRARKRNAPINDFTGQQWETMKILYKHRCAYCGKKDQNLTQDHIQPLSAGGSHTWLNIVPACRSCNSRKHTGPPPMPIQPFLL